MGFVLGGLVRSCEVEFRIAGWFAARQGSRFPFFWYVVVVCVWTGAVSEEAAGVLDFTRI